MAAIEDREIIALYNARDEGAIIRKQERYGSFCYRIARNILSIHEDAEECVSDTYQVVWNRIPPERPLSLRAFLGRITRNLSISRYRAKSLPAAGAILKPEEAPEQQISLSL